MFRLNHVQNSFTDVLQVIFLDYQHFTAAFSPKCSALIYSAYVYIQI